MGIIRNLEDRQALAKLDKMELDSSGDLKFIGTTTTVSATNLTVEDKLIELGNGVTGTPSGDAGLIIERGSSANAAIVWDESRDEFVLGTTSATGASTGDLTVTPGNVTVERISAGYQQAEAEVHAVRDISSGSRSTTAPIISEDDARPAIQLVGSANNIGLIQFGDNAAEASGQVYYDHSTDKLRVDCGGNSDRITVDADGDIVVTGTATVSGGAVQLGNGQSGIILVADTAHDTAGKLVTLSAGATTAGTTSNIAGGDLELRAGQGKGTGAGGDILFRVANAGGSGSALNSHATALTISDDSKATFATDVTTDGSLFLKEKADAEGDTAAYGQLWVNTATPNQLYFTTDAGNDIQLTDGTSTAGGGGAVSAVANGSDNRIATFSSSDALNGEANLSFDGSVLTVVGEVSVGSGSARGVIESNGDQDLLLQTGNSATGTIAITDGTNGDITFTPNGTGAVESAGYFHHEKGIQGAYTALTTDTTLSDTHFIVQASRSAVLTLPAVSADNAGRWYFITRVDDGTSNGTIDIDANASETIEGNLEYHLESDGDGVALYDNGSKWIVMWEKIAPTRAGFAPTDVENCVIWLSGGVGITTDGSGDVTQWADQSGNSNHAIQLGSQPMPTTATVESTTVPAFTGRSGTDGDVLNMTTNVIDGNDEPWTIFTVINTSGNAPASTHIFGVGSDSNASTGFLYSAENGFGKKLFVDASNKAGFAMLNSDAGAETISAHTLNGTEVIIASYAGPGQLKLDGGNRKWTCSENALGSELVYDKLNIGASSGDGTAATIDGFTGNVCELIVYQRALDHSEIMLVRDYLLSRWT